MASLRYLLKNRIKFPLGSKSFLRAWAKRVLSLPILLNRVIRRSLLISKGAQIADTAELSKIKIGGNKNKLIIGSNTFIGKIEIALHDNVTIGDFVCINDGVILLTASHDLNDPTWHLLKKPIIIHDYAWIATNAIILPGVTIGKGAVVGAGAVVSKDIGDFQIVAGNPAIPINRRRTEILLYNPCEFLAENRAWTHG